MSHRQRPQGLRPRIDYEAHVLTSISGREAYWVARQRAEEASSEDMARDWTAVAAIARRSGRRQSFFRRHVPPVARMGGIFPLFASAVCDAE